MLTHQKDATAVFVVHDEDGFAGVYYSLERAKEYIDDWLLAAEQPSNGEPIVTISKTEHQYRGLTISETYLRS